MTDNEIIKALEHCKQPAGKHDCKHCPFVLSKGVCTTWMLDAAIALLNRQKAEIEKLNQINFDLCNAGGRLLHKTETIKAEAVKEFAERLKDRFCQEWMYRGVCVKEEIDNLVKEMVGDNNAE